MTEQWEPYQKKYWTNTWENSPYSAQELIDGDPWIGVKFSPLLPYIFSYINKDSKILEAGCGLGQWVIYLSECGFDVIGIDFSESIIEKLCSLYPNKKFMVGDVTKYEFADGTFDAVLSWGVVEHFIEGPLVALKETNRILKKNGILFITVPCKNIFSILLTPFYFIRIYAVKLVKKLIGKTIIKSPFFQYTFKKKQFEKNIKNAGFITLKVTSISHDVGFALIVNSFFKFKRESRFFYKNKRGKWQGLTLSGKILCAILKKISPWLTPDQIFIIAKKPS